MAELEAIKLLYPDADAKNLFVRDDKRRNYYLITAKGDMRIFWRWFKELLRTDCKYYLNRKDPFPAIRVLVPFFLFRLLPVKKKKN